MNMKRDGGIALVDGELYSIAPIEWKKSDITLKIVGKRVIAYVFDHEITKGVRFYAIAGQKILNLNPNTGEIEPLKPGVFTIRAVFKDWHLEISHEIRPQQRTPADPDCPPAA